MKQFDNCRKCPFCKIEYKNNTKWYAYCTQAIGEGQHDIDPDDYGYRIIHHTGPYSSEWNLALSVPHWCPKDKLELTREELESIVNKLIEKKLRELEII